MNSLFDIATSVALVINLIALFWVIYQTELTKRSLTLTKQSIDDAKTQRQLEILPKVAWIIEVQVKLEFWEKDLQERTVMLQKGINEKNNVMIKSASETKIMNPKDLSLDRFLYDKIPSWLRELWMSGAQYYYDAIAPLSYAYKDKEANYDYSQKWIDERSKDSLHALSTLLDYFENMIPPVILNTPTSLSNEDFLRD
ncbi:MAG: hypothetical protein ACP5N7_06425 [Candidatus Pacearchaeota archaeon]